MKRFAQAAWQRWKVIAERIAVFQSKVLFTFLYFVVVTPFALGLKIFSDPLRLKAGATPAWLVLARQTRSLAEARRQF